MNPRKFLERNDARTFFQCQDSSVNTSPMISNANDLRAIWIAL